MTSVNIKAVRQHAAATLGLLKPLGMGFQRVRQALKQLIFSKACSVVLMGPGQARLWRDFLARCCSWNLCYS